MFELQKKTLKSCQTNPFDSGPDKIKITDVKARSKIVLKYLFPNYPERHRHPNRVEKTNREQNLFQTKIIKSGY